MTIKSDFWEVTPLGLTHRATFRSNLLRKGYITGVGGFRDTYSVHLSARL